MLFSPTGRELMGAISPYALPWTDQSWRIARANAAVGRAVLKMYVQVLINFGMINTRAG